MHMHTHQIGYVTHFLVASSAAQILVPIWTLLVGDSAPGTVGGWRERKARSPSGVAEGSYRYDI